MLTGAASRSATLRWKIPLGNEQTYMGGGCGGKEKSRHKTSILTGA